MVKLRDYQREVVIASRKAVRKGMKRGLVALPTGTGKTVCFAHYPKVFKGRMLVVAHREELLAQAAAQIERINPGLRVDIDQAGLKGSTRADVVVGSIQTLRNAKRISVWQPDHFGTIVIDEAHHAPAPSYLKMLAHFGLAPEPSELYDVKPAEAAKVYDSFRPKEYAPNLFGYTATPSRTDNKGLEYIFDEIVYSKTMLEMMEAEWLCKVRGIQINTGVDIRDTKVTAGEFQTRDLSDHVDVEKRNRLALTAYKSYASDRQAIVFAVDVQHARDLASIFQRGGVKAEVIHGGTNKLERPKLINAYKRGELQVLVNCMVLTEGFDAPETSCLIMARPTKSQLLYTQMLGRGTRIARDKPDLLVIDLVDISGVGVPNMNSLFGLPPKLKLEDTDVLTAKRAVEAAEEKVSMDSLFDAETLADVAHIAQHFDPVRIQKPEEWLKTTMAWIKTSYGYALSLSEGRTIGVIVGHLDSAQVRVMNHKGEHFSLGWHRTIQRAIDVAEEWVVAKAPDNLMLSAKDAKWRLDQPSEKQLAFARQLGIAYPKGISKGDLSQLITAKLDSNKRTNSQGGPSYILRGTRTEMQSAGPIEPTRAPVRPPTEVRKTLDDLLYLYARQTEDEKGGKRTEHENGVGFNSFDAQFGSDMAEKVLSNQPLTEKQLNAISKMLVKYRKQLEYR